MFIFVICINEIFVFQICSHVDLEDAWLEEMMTAGLQTLVRRVSAQEGAGVQLAAARTIRSLAEHPQMAILILDQAMPALLAIKDRSAKLKVCLLLLLKYFANIQFHDVIMYVVSTIFYSIVSCIYLFRYSNIIFTVCFVFNACPNLDRTITYPFQEVFTEILSKLVLHTDHTRSSVLDYDAFPIALGMLKQGPW